MAEQASTPCSSPASGTRPAGALAMEQEEGPATATAMQETIGGESTQLAGAIGRGMGPNPYRVQQIGEDGTNGRSQEIKQPYPASWTGDWLRSPSLKDLCQLQ